MIVQKHWILLIIGTTADISDVSAFRITSIYVYCRYNNRIVIFSDVLNIMITGLVVNLLIIMYDWKMAVLS
jgi:hypothetical protein